MRVLGRGGLLFKEVVGQEGISTTEHSKLGIGFVSFTLRPLVLGGICFLYLILNRIFFELNTK